VTPGPRLFGIPATAAPIVAVLRRGPSAWSHVGRWDVARGIYEPGAWIRANLHPQRCDLSPDGRWLCYFTLKGQSRWKAGWTYIALSRLPWLTALAAWGTSGTWTRGAHFVDQRGTWEVGEPAEGDASPCRRKFGLALTRPATFAVERRRGWTETADTPPRAARDVWDERRADRVTMEKPRPKSDGAMRLTVRGWHAAFRDGPTGGVAYTLLDRDRVRALAEVQWADWDAAGHLLSATRDGRLRIQEVSRAGDLVVVSEADPGALRPAPAPPPADASHW
jgi:hypothetical protein